MLAELIDSIERSNLTTVCTGIRTALTTAQPDQIIIATTMHSANHSTIFIMSDVVHFSEQCENRLWIAGMILCLTYFLPYLATSSRLARTHNDLRYRGIAVAHTEVDGVWTCRRIFRQLNMALPVYSIHERRGWNTISADSDCNKS